MENTHNDINSSGSGSGNGSGSQSGKSGSLGLETIVHEGYLKKWTNYYHGWQDRYIILNPTRFSYFKDKEDTDISCKGSVNIARIKITINNYDDYRFDINAGNTHYYFRAETIAQRNIWMHHLETLKVYFYI